MSTTPDMTVVVAEERRRRLPVPLVAAAVGALLLGGSTFALWSTSGTLTGGTITAGNLDLTVGTTAFYDVSADRSDATEQVLAGLDDTVMGHAITPATWRIVPGDKVAVVFPVTVTLEGDNMVASLSLTNSGNTLGNAGMTYTYSVYVPGATVPIVDGAPLSGLATPQLVYLAGVEAGGGGVDAESTTPVYEMTSASEALTVVVYGTFAATAQSYIGAQDALGGFAVQLDQVRDPGTGLFTTAP